MTHPAGAQTYTPVINSVGAVTTVNAGQTDVLSFAATCQANYPDGQQIFIPDTTGPLGTSPNNSNMTFQFIPGFITTYVLPVMPLAS